MIYEYPRDFELTITTAIPTKLKSEENNYAIKFIFKSDNSLPSLTELTMSDLEFSRVRLILNVTE